MIILLVIVFGTVGGIASFAIKGSGYGLRSDIILGIFGSAIASSIMAAAYELNHFGRPDAFGLSWYSLTVGTIGAVTAIYLTWMYKRANAV
jgi:uncharacterized membrane protein YeaQ/YmgE (transglycosylase-associated protein family)